jgi:molybdate transport system regulatory protein
MLPEWTPKTNIWLEVDGKVAFSRWRAQLLLAVDRTGSISGAAKEMDIQYRLAWQRINEMEKRLGVSLVEPRVGGRGGGGSELTSLAFQLIERFDKMAQTVDLCTIEQSRIQFYDLLKEQ